ncbi:MAG: 3-deoxy-8-phosphooctulonate synthase, partial [Deltaproteobacteria bacterium]|nr:3-deoxy-8-phosphooctulonate synthase [Deltaproteobacteria bacterium]
EFVPCMARAAVAVGVDGIFVEVHKDPGSALCDGPNSVALQDLMPLLKQLKAIRGALSTAH